jgi:uncharacterized protein YbaA (DUF1428 family)
MTHIQIYIYRIPKPNRKEFLETMRKAREIYRKHGAKGEELYILEDKTPRYGLTGLWELLCTPEKEDIWIGLDTYTDAEHCRIVMKAVDADPDIEPLYKRVVELVGSAELIIRAPFDKVEY